MTTNAAYHFADSVREVGASPASIQDFTSYSFLSYAILSQGNDIIQRLQEEQRSLKAKLRKKAEVIRRQESALSEAAEEGAAQGRDAAATAAKLARTEE